MTDEALCPTCGKPLDGENFEAHTGLFTILARLPRADRRVILDRLMALAETEAGE